MDDAVQTGSFLVVVLVCFNICWRATQEFLFLNTANGGNFIFRTLFPRCIQAVIGHVVLSPISHD